MRKGERWSEEERAALSEAVRNSPRYQAALPAVRTARLGAEVLPETRAKLAARALGIKPGTPQWDEFVKVRTQINELRRD